MRHDAEHKVDMIHTLKGLRHTSRSHRQEMGIGRKLDCAEDGGFRPSARAITAPQPAL